METMKPFVQKGELSLRFASVCDAPLLREIYAPYVQMPVSFEYELPSVEEFSRRIHERSGLYPYIVLSRNNEPIGYAYASRFKLRGAYQWDVELSIYVGQHARGCKAGTVMLTALLEVLKQQGVRNAFSVIGGENKGSAALHEKLGFELVGVQKRAAYKCGAWHDTCMYQKDFDNFSFDPDPITPVSELDQASVEAAFADALDLICPSIMAC